MNRRRSRLLTSLGTAGLLCGAALVPLSHSTVASAAPGDSVACPAPFPATDLTDGMAATGLTTAGYYPGGPATPSKVTPEAFDGRYLGTVEDPTGDLFLFELSGSRITRPDGTVDAGIWQGISGSPLYATDGRLIGSVSYAFTQISGSAVAGVTPAADLYDLLEETTAPAARRIVLDKSERAMLRRAGVPARAASADLTRLTTPTAVSGLRGVPPTMVAAIARKAGVAVPRLAGGTSTQDEMIPVVPGGNVAVAVSHGSMAIYSVGTASAVCDDVVIGYGHSNEWRPTGATIHGASTATIMADGAISYKMANLGAPVGTLLHDRLNGITGRLDTVPAGTTVTVTSTGPKGRTTETVVSEPDALAFVIGNQTYRDAALTLDESAAGTAAVSWEITFTREDGSSQTFTRSQRYASAESIPDEVPNDVAGDVQAILDNGFEDVTVTDVAIRQDVSRSYRAYRIGKVETRSGGTWQTLNEFGRITAKAGSKIKVRVQLQRESRRAAVSPVSRTFTFKVPAKATKRGMLSIVGNGASFWDFEDFFFMPEDADGGQPESLDELLATMKATPKQDTVDLSLTTMTARGEKTSASVWRPGEVVQGEVSAMVKIKPKKKAKKR